MTRRWVRRLRNIVGLVYAIIRKLVVDHLYIGFAQRASRPLLKPAKKADKVEVAMLAGLRYCFVRNALDTDHANLLIAIILLYPRQRGLKDLGPRFRIVIFY